MSMMTPSVAMAESMGARGMRLSQRSEVHAVVTEALRHEGPVVVDVDMDVDMDVASPVYNPVAFHYPNNFYDRGLAAPPF